MRIISFIAVTFFTAFWSIPAYTAETFVCNNWLSDEDFKYKSKTVTVFATTSAVLNIEKNKITNVTYVVKAFVNGKIKETWKYSLDCNVPDVENDKLECLQDNRAKRLEGTEIDTSQISDYSYLKISKYRDQTEASLLSELRDGGDLGFSFGDLMIKKTIKGTELDANADEIQMLSCD